MPARRRRRPLLPTLALVALLATLAGCGVFAGGGGDIAQGELLIELTDAINEMRAQDAQLQEELDGLRAELARQDTVLARLAAATGVPLSR